MKNQMQLYSYYRSSCSYRVRIALYLKNISFKYIPVHLVKNGGEQKSKQYKKVNPEGQVPCLVHKNRTITQSMAILQYLEDIQPHPVLFPKSERPLVISICEIINSNTQPLQNLKVLQYLNTHWRAGEQDKKNWLSFWSREGLSSAEQKARANKQSPFAVGRALTAAELFIVPQIYNAKRFNVSIKDFPRLLEIEGICQFLPAFRKAHPDTQPDTPPDQRKK